ncbi:glycerol-3-phosphate 1-O-acyltransferase PlsY [Cytobacillus spongiae]|uniref:glycerol-3-phosphate 1-O-acyltransferase PlsY n=1 Tax=Cytobacillus spongiae TaxID=2901381 RepID=UPI001F321EDB|nr:glycerol-3-phosphate 1-O-acyltransferase PlsY [Cytobacillus spongiae]UII56366.1 glycerol-3-phosphate 1-O-acyltransferase PlsY [Cytobacillus spongiae]
MEWIFFVSAYLLGSIPTALLVGKLYFQIDIRNHGSHNPGATNTLRVLGKKAAIGVLLIDVGKGALAASLPLLFELNVEPLYLGLVAVIGHCFPVFAGFRGGKAIATTAGALLIANPWVFLFTYLTFLFVIYLTKYVFLGSISVGVALLIYSLFIPGSQDELIFSLFLFFLIFLHRTNIRNFLNGEEPKVNDKNLKNDRVPPKG